MTPTAPHLPWRRCGAVVVRTGRALPGAGVTLRAGVFALDGSRQLVEEAQGADPAELGRKVAEVLLERGAADLME